MLFFASPRAILPRWQQSLRVRRVRAGQALKKGWPKPSQIKQIYTNRFTLVQQDEPRCFGDSVDDEKLRFQLFNFKLKFLYDFLFFVSKVCRILFSKSDSLTKKFAFQ